MLNSDALPSEAHFIHRAIFGTIASQMLAERYARAHEYCCYPSGPAIDVEKILKLGLDVEAIELATRQLKTVLSKKMQLIIYLAEVAPDYSDFFVNKRDCRFHAWMALTLNTIRTVYKLVKGRLLVWRYKLV